MREEEEGESETEVKTSESEPEPETISPSITSEHQQCVHELLEELRKGQCPQDPDEGHENAGDTALNALDYKDFPKLRQARVKLAVKAKDKKLDVTF